MPPQDGSDDNKDLINKHIHEKYLGSKGIDVIDSIDLCDYFVQSMALVPARRV